MSQNSPIWLAELDIESGLDFPIQTDILTDIWAMWPMQIKVWLIGFWNALYYGIEPSIRAKRFTWFLFTFKYFIFKYFLECFNQFLLLFSLHSSLLGIRGL